MYHVTKQFWELFNWCVYNTNISTENVQISDHCIRSVHKNVINTKLKLKLKVFVIILFDMSEVSRIGTGVRLRRYFVPIKMY